MDMVHACNERSQSYNSTSVTDAGNDRGGRTLVKRFLKAAVDDDVNVAVECLEFGVDKNAADRNNKTALHYAAGAGSDGVVGLLLREGANPNAETKFGTRVREEVEYWFGKGMLGKKADFRPEKFQKCIDLLNACRASRRSADDLDSSTKKRLKALEDEAERCGIGRLMMPWCQEIGESVMLSAVECVASVDAPTVDVEAGSDATVLSDDGEIHL